VVVPVGAVARARVPEVDYLRVCGSPPDADKGNEDKANANAEKDYTRFVGAGREMSHEHSLRDNHGYRATGGNF
jgi:hypothetical protein